MGLFDILFGNQNQIPTVTTILPDVARQEIIAGRLPILNTDKLFLKRGEKIHFIDKAINMEKKTVKELPTVILLMTSIRKHVRTICRCFRSMDQT